MSTITNPIFPSTLPDFGSLQSALCSWHESIKDKAFAELILHVAINKPIPPITRLDRIERDGWLIEREERILAQSEIYTFEIPFAYIARFNGCMTKELSLNDFKEELANHLIDCSSFIDSATRGYTIALTAFACRSEIRALPTHHTWKVINLPAESTI